MRLFAAVNQPLFDRLGGKPAVSATVDIFYDKVLKDERINFMFSDTDMKKQKRHQRRFMTMAFGGPNLYSGDSMSKAHEKVNLGERPTEEHFGAVAECLIETLQELKIPQADIDEVVEIVLTTKSDILGK